MAATRKKKPAAKSRARSGRAAAASTATKASAPATSSAMTTAKGSTSTAGGLTKAEAKRALFVEHYLANGGNATQAAISAGYAPRSAHVEGCKLLKNPNVAAQVAERTKTAVQEASLTTDRVLRELGCIVHFNPKKLLDEKGKLKSLHELDDDTARAIATVEFDEKGNMVKVRAWDKNAATANAMRYLGLMKPDVPIVPPSAGTVIHAQNVVVMDPMDAYKRMLGATPKAA